MNDSRLMDLLKAVAQFPGYFQAIHGEVWPLCESLFYCHRRCSGAIELGDQCCPCSVHANQHWQISMAPESCHYPCLPHQRHPTIFVCTRFQFLNDHLDSLEVASKAYSVRPIANLVSTFNQIPWELHRWRQRDVPLHSRFRFIIPVNEEIKIGTTKKEMSYESSSWMMDDHEWSETVKHRLINLCFLIICIFNVTYFVPQILRDFQWCQSQIIFF